LTGGISEVFHAHLVGFRYVADAGRVLERRVPHLVRGVRRRFGVSPHAYVIGARIEVARKLLLQGVPAAQAAVEAGFHDQAHLTRHFKRYVSVPPGRYTGGRGPAEFRTSEQA
jgi:AraC-like DNA-binding protein